MCISCRLCEDGAGSSPPERETQTGALPKAHSLHGLTWPHAKGWSGRMAGAHPACLQWGAPLEGGRSTMVPFRQAFESPCREEIPRKTMTRPFPLAVENYLPSVPALHCPAQHPLQFLPALPGPGLAIDKTMAAESTA